MSSAARPEIEELLAAAPLRLVTLEKYHQMIESGVLDEDDRVELLNGVIVEMSPQDERHIGVISRLTRALNRALDESYEVRPQGPLTLAPDSEPEPDIAVVRASDRRGGKHPATAIVVVEVSDSSLRKDRRVKGALYAKAAVGEYWIVNVRESCVERHRDPDAANARYQTMTTLRGSDVLETALLPGFSLPVALLLAE